MEQGKLKQCAFCTHFDGKKCDASMTIITNQGDGYFYCDSWVPILGGLRDFYQGLLQLALIVEPEEELNQGGISNE